MFPRADGQLGSDLLVNALGEIGRGGVIHGDDDGAAQRAAEERSDALGGIRPPEQNPVAFGDGTCLEFAGELKRGFSYAAITPTYGAVTLTLHVGGFRPSMQEVVKIVDE